MKRKIKWSYKYFSSDEIISLSIKCPRCLHEDVYFGQCINNNCDFGKTKEDLIQMRLNGILIEK